MKISILNHTFYAGYNFIANVSYLGEFNGNFDEEMLARC
jgi:hypothetical protein